MDEQKMISIEKMDEIIMDYYPDTVAVDFHGQELVIRRTITMEEMALLTKTVAERCFDEKTGEYLPELLRYLTDILIIAFYTNVRVPRNAEKQYRMLRQTDLMRVVHDNISDDQYYEITEAIDDRIRLRNERNTKMVEKQIQDAVSSVTAIADLLDGMFDGVDKDDVAEDDGIVAWCHGFRNPHLYSRYLTVCAVECVTT